MSTRSTSIATSARTAVIGAALALITALLVLPGCADETYASPEGHSPPYILKEGCMFKIVGENGSAGVGSPKVDGMPDGMASASTSFGEYSIAVSDCELIENSHGLPVYER